LFGGYFPLRDELPNGQGVLRILKAFRWVGIMELKHWDLWLVTASLGAVIGLYFFNNPMGHSAKFMIRRFVNWFPLGMTYAFLYMGRYNLNVCKNALDHAISNIQFGWIFGIGTTVYAASLFLNGPLVDRLGGKKGILIAAVGACLANAGMGLATYLYLHGHLANNLAVVLTILYSINMFFQSYGAVSIIKVKAYWFHVRERGIFGAILGTLISFGVYFAFDWGKAIVDAAKAHIVGEPTGLQRFFRAVFATDASNVDAVWLVFFIPAFLILCWAMLDLWLIKDTPEEAGFEAFDTHDASSGEMDVDMSKLQLIKRIFSSPIIITVE
jgi:OPA family glycerol-3-phosphate transporter-like MFS transporter